MSKTRKKNSKKKFDDEIPNILKPGQTLTSKQIINLGNTPIVIEEKPEELLTQIEISERVFEERLKKAEEKEKEQERMAALKKAKEEKEIKTQMKTTEIPIILTNDTEKNHPSISKTLQKDTQSHPLDKFTRGMYDILGQKAIEDLIEEILGFDRPHACGWMIITKTYVRPVEAVSTGGLFLPDTVRESDKYLNPVGLVIAIGNDAYRLGGFRKTLYEKIFDRNIKKPMCKVGDWVVYPPASAQKFMWRGIPIGILQDEHISMIVEDPKHIERN